MKIIIINYRYFISGGPERYLFNVMALLEENGHTVIPFSVKAIQNKPSHYEKYFLSEIGTGNEIYYDQYKKTNFKTLRKTFARMFYSFEAKRKLSKLISDVSPDLIYVLHFQNKISASIFDAAKKYKVPVVHRVSDFGEICANGYLYKMQKKENCELCVKGSKFNAIKYKCVRNSYFFSAIKAASLQLQSIIKVEKKIHAFVFPSSFTKSKFLEYGYPSHKLNHIPTFFNFNLVKEKIEIIYGHFGLYIGRVEEEKGLMTLIKAFENTSYNLKIIGASSTGYDKILSKYLHGKNHNIEFLGKKDFEEIQGYLSTCAFTIVPSENYDNFPNTVLESYAFKKCVIATNNGSLKDMVEENITGLLFPIKDVNVLKNKIDYLFKRKEVCKELGDGGYQKLIRVYSSESHYNSLISLFEKTIRNTGKQIIQK